MSSTKKNYAYQIFYQLLISVLPFVTSPYISRVLGADGIGTYSYTFSVITYFKTFAALGIVNYGNRAIAKAKEDKEQLNRTFSSLFALHALLSGVVIVAYLAYWKVFVTEHKAIAMIQIICLVSELLDINWFYFGMEKFRLTVIRNSLVKVAAAVAVFVFVREPGDVWKYTLIMGMGTLIGTSAVWMFLPKYVKFSRFTVREMFRHLKPMLVLFFAVIAISIYSYMDKIMLGALSSYAELGYYENAWKMIEFPGGFITALSTVMLPKISNLITKGDDKTIDRYIHDSMRFSMVASIAIAFGVAGIAKEFAVVFWGADFATSGTLMMVLAPSIVLMSWNTVIRAQYLIPREHDKVYLLAVCCGAAVNFAVNWLLIPKYGSVGAAVGTVLAYAAICLVQTWYASRALSTLRYFLQSVPYAGIGLVMYFAVRLVGDRMGACVPALFAEVVVGVLVFGVLTLGYAVVFRDRFVLDRLRQVKDMIWKKSGR